MSVNEAMPENTLLFPWRSVITKLIVYLTKPAQRIATLKKRACFQIGPRARFLYISNSFKIFYAFFLLIFFCRREHSWIVAYIKVTSRFFAFFFIFLLHCHFDLITVKYFFSRKTDSFLFCFQYFTVSYWRRRQLFCSVESTTFESQNRITYSNRL